MRIEIVLSCIAAVTFGIVAIIAIVMMRESEMNYRTAKRKLNRMKVKWMVARKEAKDAKDAVDVLRRQLGDARASIAALTRNNHAMEALLNQKWIEATGTMDAGDGAVYEAGMAT